MHLKQNNLLLSPLLSTIHLTQRGKQVLLPQ
jgi:hypothetical protein